MQPAIAAQSAHWDFLVAMASVGLGVALLPEPLMGRMKTRGLSTAKLAKRACNGRSATSGSSPATCPTPPAPGWKCVTKC